MQTETPVHEPGQQINGAEQPAPTKSNPLDAAKEFVAAKKRTTEGLLQHRDQLKAQLAEANETLRKLGHVTRGPNKPKVVDTPAETAAKPTGKAKGGK